jgi:predicted nuclease of restriction endonuclease-like RecB superfamily
MDFSSMLLVARNALNSNTQPPVYRPYFFMLRSEHSIVRYDRDQAIPDRLTRVTHKHYLQHAQRMLTVYTTGINRTRRELHRSIRGILADEPDCDPRRISALCKILDDAGTFDKDKRGAAAKLRLQVFSIAAKYHPLVTETDGIFERTERETKSLIATELGKPYEEIDAGLYVDVIDRQPLREFPAELTPQELLSQYNLAQLQACLYQCQRMSVEATTDFATIVRYAKLCRLLVETRRVTSGYRIDMSGPATVLHETRRYGVNFARFVAALASCRNWKMHATVATRWGRSANVKLDGEAGYRTHITAPEDFDSQVEKDLAEQWGEVREGWRLLRDAGILQYGQTTFVPDFKLIHEDGREVFLEIVGFWTPEYLAAKRETIKKFRDHRILLAIPVKTAKEGAAGLGAIVYRTKIDTDDVVRMASAIFEKI